MTDAEKLIELAGRVEGAGKGSRELDDAIAAEVFRFAGMSQLLGVPDDQQFRTFTYLNGSIGSSLRYTDSLDAAVTLVPDGGAWMVESTGFYAKVDYWPGMGATGALALTAAALRTRAATLSAPSVVGDL